jgi:hypothetical protein
MSADSHVTVTPPKEVEEERDKTTKKTSSSSGPRKRATRIPDDFAVTDEMAEWARREVPALIAAGNGKRETEKFRNYWQAKSGRDATKHDWVATWRNWLLKADDDLGRNGNGSGRGTALAVRPSTTDQRVAQAEALKAELRIGAGA